MLLVFQFSFAHLEMVVAVIVGRCCGITFDV